jgi:hypothetical protein
LIRCFLRNVHKGGYLDPGISEMLRQTLYHPNGGYGVYQVMTAVAEHPKVLGAMVAPPPSSPHAAGAAHSPRASEIGGGGWGLSMLREVLSVLEALRADDAELEPIRRRLGGDVDTAATAFSPSANRRGSRGAGGDDSGPASPRGGTSAKKQRLRTLAMEAVQDPTDHFRRFMAIAGDSENWLQEEAEKEFDALVEMVESVEQLTSGGSDTVSLLSAASNVRNMAKHAAQGAAAGAAGGVAGALNSPINIAHLASGAVSSTVNTLSKPVSNPLTKPKGAHGGGLVRQDSFVTHPKASTVLCPVPMGKFVGRLVRHIEWAVTTRLPLQVEGMWGADHKGGSIEEEVVLVRILRRIVQRHKEDEDAENSAAADGSSWFGGGTAMDPAFMHRLRQNELDAWGVTNAMLTVLAAPALQHDTQLFEGHHVVECSEELVDEALLMLAALLDGGNEQVQATMDHVLTGGAGGSEVAATKKKASPDDGKKKGAGSAGAAKGAGRPDVLRTDRLFQLLRDRVDGALHMLTELREGEALLRAAAEAGATGGASVDDLVGQGHILYDPRQRLVGIFDVMQLMCENHNRRMQDLLRTQDGLQVGQANRDVNLIKVACQVLAIECADERQVRYKRHSDIPVLVSASNFLTECMQGPCPENQALVSSLVAEASKRVIKESFKISRDLRGGGSTLVAEAKEAVMKMVCAMLEGRADQHSRFVHHQLVDKLGTPTLKHRLGEVYTRIVKLRKIVRPTRAGGGSAQGVSGLINSLRNGTMALLPDFISCAAMTNWCKRGFGIEVTDTAVWKSTGAAQLEEEYERVLEEGFNLYAMILQLGAVRADVLVEVEPTEDEVMRHTKYAAAYKYFSRKVRTVEVYWRGSVQLLPFLMPEIVELADDRKHQLLSTIDLGIGGTDKKHLLEFVEACGELSDELEYFTKLKDSLYYQFFRSYYLQFKYALYFGAVLINFIVLLSVQVPLAGGPDALVNNTGVTGAWAYENTTDDDGLPGDDKYLFGETPEYQPAAMEHVKGLVAFALFFGHLLVLGYLLMSRAPLVGLKLARRRRERKADTVAQSEAEHAEKRAEEEAEAMAMSEESGSIGGGSFGLSKLRNKGSGANADSESCIGEFLHHISLLFRGCEDYFAIFRPVLPWFAGLIVAHAIGLAAVVREDGGTSVYDESGGGFSGIIDEERHAYENHDMQVQFFWCTSPIHCPYTAHTTCSPHTPQHTLLTTHSSSLYTLLLSIHTSQRTH